ncbi:hypothetical protein SISSUDRAFT_1030214 [Sistotremastrum suecicum HHB10207 ss-3]|uniref:MARVEL domain-containing protein n=1 Tax=Sistotremastrum suecicum HHB10207 ss-3 TaxID=1314776 RepID=A0A166HT28_9AGAM|nr:hypothetical protein SISSUDRAFT_1030214 [Sistotremastrum suecicum HHB10207 ss-3]
MHNFHLARLVVFGTVLLLSLIVLGLSANINHDTSNIQTGFGFEFGFTFVFSSLSLAISVISIVVIVPVLVLDHLRKGVITSMVVVELAWTFVLWVIWLAAAAESAQAGDVFSHCGNFDDIGVVGTVCHSWGAIVAFDFINWLALLGWFTTLLVFSIRGRHWNNYVTEESMVQPYVEENKTAPAQAPVANYQYPPQQQQQPQMEYAPTQSPAGTNYAQA